MPKIYPTIDRSGYKFFSGPYYTDWSNFYGADASSMVATTGGNSSIFTTDQSSGPALAEQKRYHVEFDISGITSIPSNGTFNFYGGNTGLPSTICVQASFATAGAIVVGDWDSWNESSPVYYTDEIESWSSGYNVFTLTQTALDFMGNPDNDEFQMICMDSVYHAIDAAPIADGGESDPYFETNLYYRMDVPGKEPYLDYTILRQRLGVKSGILTLKSGKLIIK